jgi:hypothetical protein
VPGEQPCLCVLDDGGPRGRGQWHVAVVDVVMLLVLMLVLVLVPIVVVAARMVGAAAVKGWTTAALSPRQCRYCCRLQSAAAEAAAPLLSPAPHPPPDAAASAIVQFLCQVTQTQ